MIRNTDIDLHIGVELEHAATALALAIEAAELLGLSETYGADELGGHLGAADSAIARARDLYCRFGPA